MKILSSSLIAFLILTNFAFSQNNLDQAIATFVKKSGFEHASISIHVVDLADNSTVAEHNSKISLTTASTAKLFSTATALDLLGPSYKATTRLYIDGEIEEGVLNGNLWIRGGGDPSLGSKYYNSDGHQLDFMLAWADSLKALGIKKINGKIIADASEFGYQGAPDGWIWTDLGNYYGAGPSGLTIYDNLLKYDFSTSSSAGKPAKLLSIEPSVPGLKQKFNNYVVSSKRNGDHVYLYGAPYSIDRFGSGTLPIGRSSFIVKGSLPDPEKQFAYEFHLSLVEAGIVSDGYQGFRSTNSNSANYSDKTLILSHRGKSIEDLITKTNHKSINLYAEHMISLIGHEKGKNGSTKAGLEVLDKHWSEKINTQGMFLQDGSGLARTNALSARNFTSLLSYMKSSKHQSVFTASLPVAGISGTMRNVCKGQAGHKRISAKSGSMKRVSSYAGYVDSSTGKKLAFAIIVNNYDCSYGQTKLAMQALMNAMAKF